MPGLEERVRVLEGMMLDIRVANARLESQLTALQNGQVSLLAEITKLTAIKNNGLGLLAGVALVFTLAGAKMASIVEAVKSFGG